MKQRLGKKILSMILAVAIILSVGVMPVYAVEGGDLPVIVSQESSSTVVEPETCSSCGKAAHEGACETTENTEPEVAIPTSEGEKECTCPTVDSGEVTHKEGCPQYIAPAYQCPFCKDERLDEHVDGICPLAPVLNKMQLLTAKTSVMTEEQLNAAIAEAPTDGTATTINLGESFSVDQSVSITEANIILDLNGYTLTSNSVSTIIVTSSGRLEIIDTSEGAAGVVSASGEKPVSGEPFYTIDSNGTVKISSGTVTAKDQCWAAINNRGGTVEVTGGTVSTNSNLYSINNNYTSSGVVNVSGGTVSAPAFAINNQGTVNITGGTVAVSGNGYTIINSYTGIVNVSGGEVTAPSSGGQAIRSHNGGIVNITGGTVTAGSIAIDSATADEEVNISGGTMGGVAVKKLNLSGNPTLSIILNNMQNNQISITGELTGADGGIELNAQYGISPTLTVIATATTPEHAVVEKFALVNSVGKSLVKNGANIEIVQAPSLITSEAELNTAITNAASTGTTTIKLGNNFSISSSANITDKNIMLDLNGFTLSSTTNTLFLNGTASLEIKDTSIGENGVVSSSGGNTIYNNGSGTVKVSSGKVFATGDGKRAILNNESGTVNVTGGTVTATGNGSYVYAIYNVLNGTVNISGGTIGKVSSGALNLSGNPTLTVYLLALSDNRVNIIGELTGAEGSITLDATGLPPTVTAVATATTPDHAVAEKFALANLTGKKLVKNGANIEITQTNPTAWDGTLPAANPVYTFSGGDGTLSAPYQVDNSYDLAMLAANVNNIDNYSKNKFFLMTDDIVLNDSLDGTPKAWKPIGKRTNVIDPNDIKNAFQGSFNGGGHTVKGAYITGSSAYQGLFGLICDAVVSNLGIVDSDIHGDNYVGSIVGFVQNSTVEKCYNTGSVSATYNAGGIAGAADSTSTLKNCYNTGDVVATAHAAGGITAGNDGLIQNCYNTGKITTSLGNNGGIAAIHGGTLSNCVSLGSALSSGTSINRVVGAGFTSTMTNNYARSDMQVNGATVTGGTSSNENGADLTVSDSTAQAWSTWFSDGSAWNYPTEKLVIGAALPTLKGFAGSVVQNPTLPEAEKAPAPTAWNGVIPAANPGYSYGGGNGTAGNPYKIANGEQLAMLAANVNNDGEYSKNKFFELTADIILNDSLEGSPNAWEAIGQQSTKFEGTFNGGGHTVKGVFINKNSYYQGLFGYISGANVKNLGVIESAVTGSYDVGGVVGMSATSTVENCFNTGEVSGDGNVGGVVGNAWQTGAVSGESLVQNCYNSGSVGAESMVGGVVGTSSNITTVQNCYNIGNVTGIGAEVGGVVGRTSGGSGEGSSVINNVKNCVSLGRTVTTERSNNQVARVVGRVLDNVNITNCYARSDMKIVMSGKAATVTGGAVDNKNGADLTVSASTTQAWSTWFSDNSAWNLAEIGNLVAGAKLPVLAGFSAEQTPTLPEALAGPNPTDWASTNPTADPSYTYSGGDGTSASPYLIANSYDLAMLAANTNKISSYSSGKYFKQTADIILNSTISSSAKQWTPIGCYDYRFGGTYDGSGYTISGLYIYDKNVTTGEGKALFGYISSATIQNIGIMGGSIRGQNNVGSIVGKATNNSVVEQCFNSSSVYGVKYIGGIAGYLEDSAVQNCYNTGNIVIEDTIAGGVAGYLSKSTVKKCYNTGNIIKGNTGAMGLIAGGIVGHASSSLVTNCVALGLEIRYTRPSQMNRVVSSIDNTTISYCYARQDMFINGAGTITSGRHDNQIGEGLYVNSNTNCDWGKWIGIQAAPATWTYPTGELCYGVPLPTLNGFATDSQNPILPGQAILTSGAVTRTSDTEATVKFTMDDDLTYYYAWVPSGDAAPTVDITQGGTTAQRGVENTISLNDLSAGAKDLYIVGINTFGVRTNHPKTTIPAYTSPIITITTQPKDVMVLLGKTATLRVAANLSIAGTLSYQWYKSTSNSTIGGALISGATGTSYTPPARTVAGADYYYCVVSGGGVQAVSSIACMTVRTPTMNISGVVYDSNGISPVSGAKVKLTPEAGSTEQTTGTDGKYSFLNIPIGSYTITVTFPDGTETSIIFTNTSGGDVHADDIPKPAPKIMITTQPQNVSVLQNKAASFTLAASVTNGAGVTYQWHSNSTNSTTGGALISGATSAVYTPATATVGTTYYYCVVSSANAASVTSKIASLTVRKTITITGTVKNKDGNGIKDATVKIVPDAGTPNPATTDSDGQYIFSDVPDGNYTIIVTLPNGGIIKKDITVPEDTGKVIEIIQPATPVIAITTQPNDTTVLKNKAASFTVEAGASNGAAVTYQWYSNSKSDTTGGFLISGATQASYTPVTTTTGTNFYYCVVSAKDMTSVTSKIARLTVRSTSTISGVVKDKNGDVLKDTTVKLIPDAGTPNPTKTDSNGNYKFDDVPDGDYIIVVELPDGSTINKEITVPDNIGPGGSGGNIQQPATPAIAVSAQPNNITVALNDTATFTVRASASSGTLVYQWYKNTTSSVSGGAPISGANAASYSPPTDAKGESYYYCVLNATGAAPVTTGVAKLTVRSTVTGTTITGTVKDKADKPVQGATVTITDKNNPSNKHTATTDADGNYTFTGVPDGDYMIIVTMPDGGTISGGIIAVKDGTPTNSIEIKQPTVPTVTITRQPQDISVTVGTTSSFNVVAGASSGTVDYQWYYSTTNATKNGTKIKDGTAATYAPATAKAGEYYYYCVASAGDASAVSNVAKLTVTTASAFAGTVEGNVTDGTTHALLSGIEVKIMKGGTDGTQFGDTIITGAEGKFEFIAIPYGSYSLVATKDGQTITKQINIKSSRVVENLVMISGNKDTKVEIKGDTPSVAAENLTDMFTDEDDRISAKPSAKVEIMLVVEQLENIPEAEDELINAILLTIKNGTVGLYLDAKLLKTITGMGIENVSNEAIQPPEGQKVRIVLDLPEHMRGKSGYAVLRVHEGKTLIIRPVYDSTLHTLTFDADKFSTYAITYSTEDVTKGGSRGRGNPSSTDAYNFWETVESKIMTVAQGDTVKVNAKSYDKMPTSVMDALSNKGVTLVISWNGGEDIYIPAGAAQKSEVSRVYYPLSLLAQLYKDAKISEIVQVVQGGNPETGGVGYTHDDYGKLIPIAGGVWELEASNVAENEGKLNAITPSNSGFEKDAVMPDSDGTNTAQNSNNAAKVAGLVALLATIACGVLILQKKKIKE